MSFITRAVLPHKAFTFVACFLLFIKFKAVLRNKISKIIEIIKKIKICAKKGIGKNAKNAIKRAEIANQMVHKLKVNASIAAKTSTKANQNHCKFCKIESIIKAVYKRLAVL